MKVKLIKGACAPSKGREGDAGYDIFLLEDANIKKGVSVIDTGVCVELPKGWAGLIAPRSSFAKTGVIVQQPLIDENYRGEIHIVLSNPYRKTVKLKKSQRICSLFAFPVLHEKIELADSLSESNRGESWNGSSGA